MKTQDKPKALVTGSSSGIGFAYARHLSKNGWDLDLVSQNPERAEAARAKLEGQPTTTHLADLGDQRQTSALLKKIVTPDLIVANAGITHASSVGKTEEKRRLELTYLLYGGVVELIEHYLPKMLERGSGRIVIISSIGAITPMPKSSIYASAKGGVYAYGRSLNEELRTKNVFVTVSLPGYVRTNAHRRAGLTHLETQIPGWMWVTPEQVVKETEAASLMNRAYVVPGLVYRLVSPFLGSRVANLAWRALNKRSYSS